MEHLEQEQSRRIMGGNTRYSRDTWSKNQLRDSVSNAPQYGNKACNLCEYAKVPDDLFFKVSKYKTCGDVHLELSLIKPSQATCQAGQDAYRDMCCPKSFLGTVTKTKPVLSVAVGLFLFWFFAKKARRVSCMSLRREENDDDCTVDASSDDIEGRGRSSYHRMAESDSANQKGTRSRSKSKDRVSARSRSKSRDPNGMLGSRGKEAGKAIKNKTANVVQTFKSKKSQLEQNKINTASEMQIQPYYHLHDEGDWEEGRFQQNGILNEASANAYYNLDEDTSFNDQSTMAGNTMAGNTIDAVVTQVV